MSVNQKIISALSPLGYPIVPDMYSGTGEIYMTFSYGSYGGLFADDKPLSDIYLAQIHLFAPIGWDGAEARRQIKKALFEIGFTWPEETDANSEAKIEKPQKQHIVFKCGIEEIITLNN